MVLDYIIYYDKINKVLKIPYDFNEELKDLPKGILQIYFMEMHYESLFNKKIDNLPNSITHLSLGWAFNQKIDNLPNSITHLTLGFNFDQKIDNLPNTITHLSLNYVFNQKIGHQGCEDKECPHNLPNSITHLTLGSNFDQNLDNLPISITHLFLGYLFNQTIDNLPNSITHLTLGKYFNQKITKYPESLVEIVMMAENLNNYIIPKTIETVKIYFFDNNDNIFIDNLPITIKKIKINKKNYAKNIKMPFGCIVEIYKDYYENKY